MKLLFVVTALLEVGAGLALLVNPVLTVVYLLGSMLEPPAAVSVARIGGAGLLALGIACWFAFKDGQSHATRGLVVAMSIYNIAAVVILTFSGAAAETRGIMLWPAVVVHTGMAVWCIACLQRNFPIET